MSYNITNFKVKKLEDFKISVKYFYAVGKENWHPERCHDHKGQTAYISLGSIIKGTEKNNILEVKEIYICGEGSGTAMHLVFEPGFKHSTGTLIAICVWEGGNYINKLTIIDGEIMWEEIELK